MWFLFDFVGNNSFDEIMDIWAKEIKQKRKKNCKSKKRKEQSLSLRAGPTSKK